MSTVTDGLDHVILGVDDLDHAATLCSDVLGLDVSGGGVHPDFGTMNRIVVVGSSYIELIAARPHAVPSGFVGSMLAGSRRGWVGFALSTPDPAQAARVLAQRGIPVDGPMPGRLDTGDEYSRTWSTVRLSQSVLGAPFLIHHDATGSERLRLLAGPSGLRGHRLGARAIAELLVAVENDESVAFYQRYLGLSPGAEALDERLMASTVSFALADGTTLTLARPADPRLGPVADVLRSGGSGLLAVTVAVDDLARAVRDLRGRGIGVRVDEPDDVLVGAQLQHRQTLGARIALTQARGKAETPAAGSGA